MHEMLRRFGFTYFLDRDDGGGSGGGAGDGGGGSGDDDGGGEGGSGGDDSGEKTPKTFTQAELDRKLTREHGRGKAAARKDFEEQFGVSVEDAQRILDERKAADQAAETEEKRKAREADERDRKTADRERAAGIRERNADVRAALIEEGVKFVRNDDGELTGRGARLLKLVLVDLADDADDAAIVQAIKEVKADAPELFVPVETTDDDDDEGEGDRRPPSGDLNRGQRRKQPTETDLEAGKKRAEERNKQSGAFDPVAAARGTS